MLQIKNISKKYKTGDLVQIALDDVSLNFRDNEFVSILGPSGSGKTTLLNIVGGLDKYDSGDLIINNVSTKNYKDRDWDSYRNHTIGFVFQSYNLIPHQSVLSNVELALTISGISKKERKERALAALDEVGLKEQAHKRPNQMSGGQMQRVAIARALVNNPDILLADEPTGALDTTTSVQVMELLKKVANDRLVIMVTHNPELAEEYSTRIVKLKDGKIIDDSNPFEIKNETISPKHKNLGKSSMSLFTAFSLSLNNLLTKKARTILTSFAGSIGIIGIALILSLSTGFQNYIDKIQEDTLTSYPLTITSETADMTSALLSIATDVGEGGKEGSVKEIQSISTMFSKIGKNDLTSLKKYLEKEEDFVNDYVSLIKYTYSISPRIYTRNEKGITQVNPNTMISSLSGTSNSMMGMMQASNSSIFTEMIDDQEALKGQYETLAGRWPEKYNEMILVLNDKNTIPDLLVYSLGLRDNNELKKMLSSIMAQKPIEDVGDALTFTYEDLLNIEYKLVDVSDTYKYNQKYDIYEDMSSDEAYMENVYKNAESLKIVGIVCPKEGSTSMSLTSGVAYTKELTQHIIEKASKSEIVQKQLANSDINVFSGKRFDEESEESGLDFQDMISIDEEALKKAFGGSSNMQEDMASMTQGYMQEISGAIDANTSEAETMLNNTLATLLNDLLTSYIEENKESILPGQGTLDIEATIQGLLDQIQNNIPGIQIDQNIVDQIIDQIQNANTPSLEGAILKKDDVNNLVKTYMNSEFAQSKMQELSASYIIPKEAFTEMFVGFMSGYFESLGSMSGSDNDTITLTSSLIEPSIQLYSGMLSMSGATAQIAEMMSETVMQTTILTKVGELMGELTSNIAKSMNVDPSAIAGAFQFNLDEEELTRLMTTMSSSGVEKNADTNLTLLGYQNIEEPSAISFYFKDFDSKEVFVDFLDQYNEDMEKKDDDKVIKYTDLTGILMSSMSVIVDSVSYVLIAFVSISLVVSSIMIGIITYISVLERTKEIGVLRAIGASKKNISSIFNAETFIVGFFAGLIGIGVTLALIPPINWIIHSVTGNMAINATLPIVAAIVLVILSVILTLIGGIIPSGKAAKQDPVTALRSE